MNTSWEVVPFGQDCLGNITGYRVQRYIKNGRLEIDSVYVGDIYKDRSFEQQKIRANLRRAYLNHMEGIKKYGQTTWDYCEVSDGLEL